MKTALLRFLLRGLLAAALSVSPLAGQAQTGPAAALPPPLVDLLARGGLAPDALALYLQPLDPASPIPPERTLRFRERAPMNPASVMKLLTTAIAFDRLGVDYRWQTRFIADGLPDTAGRIARLTVQGSGDPAFHEAQLHQALRALRGQGVARIAGPVQIDRSRFPLPMAVLPSIDSAGYRAYHAPADAALLNQGATTLVFQPQRGRSVLLGLIDAPRRWQVIGNVQPVGGPCLSWKNDLSVRWLKDDPAGPARLEVAGRYPLACGLQRLPIRAPDTVLLWRDWLADLWQTLGGEWEAAAEAPSGMGTNASKPPVNLFTHVSPPLAEIIRDMNQYSSNVMAENIAATVMAENHALHWDDFTKSWAAAHAVATAFWTVDKASGLSRRNRLTAESIGQLLRHGAGQAYFPALLASLPIAGQSGTLKNRLATLPGKLHLKTGRLQDVAALAGYWQSPAGAWWVVVALLNAPDAGEAAPVLDRIVEYALPREWSGQPSQLRN